MREALRTTKATTLPESLVDDKPFDGTDRFCVIGRLGAGAFGTVYRALDRQTGSQVALKVLRRTDPNALFRLKKEFRSLLEIRHPNLVRLRELHEYEGCWFFTMELVEGTDLLSHVRPNGSQCDIEQLRACVLQLAIALRVLHTAGKVHRDIKPANIRVHPEGRLVLLDFGLVSNVVDGRQTTEAGVAGTLAYMAPEQALGERVGPAADWYSVGAVLYEALTGRLPASNWPPDRGREPVKRAEPRDLVSATPADLNALCTALLHPDPAQRPTGQAVVEALSGGKHLASNPGVDALQPARFIGRVTERAALDQAYQRVCQGMAGTVLITGESGAGKTALFSEVAAGFPTFAVVLRGRCLEQEILPYRAFDSVVDALSVFLRGLSDAECAALMPRRSGLLPRVFPVLARVPTISGAPKVATPIDDVAAKQHALTALRDMLALIGERRPLVIFIDDVQWADPESLALIERIMAPPDTPAMLVVFAGRPKSECSRTVQRALSALLSHNAVELSLSPLSPRESEDLVRGMVGQSLESVPVIARECAGNPLLLSFLAREVMTREGAEKLSLAAALSEALSSTSEPANKVFSVLCIASIPLSEYTVAVASGLTASATAEILAELKTRKLLRAAGLKGQSYEVFHDRLRAAFYEGWDVTSRADTHRRLARALESEDVYPPEIIVGHLVEAGESERAAGYAVHAAERACDALAFERAVHFYRVALSSVLRSGDPQAVAGLRTRIGDALAACGRSPEAAETYLLAAQSLEGIEDEDGARNLRVRAALRLLESGHHERGSQLLDQELRVLGIAAPHGRFATFVKLAASWVRLRMRGLDYVRRDPKEVSPADAVRIDACAAAAVGLAEVDPWRSAYLQLLHVHLALSSGDESRIGHALLRIGMYRALLSVDTESSEVAQILAVTERIARELQEPKLLALSEYMPAVRAYSDGRFQDAMPLFERARELAVSLSAEIRPELIVLQQLEMTTMQHVGRWVDLTERIEEDIQSARDRGDLFTTAYLELAIFPLLTLARDDVLSAEELVARAAQHATTTSIVGRELFLDFSTVALRIYTGAYAGLASWSRQRFTVWRDATIRGVPMLYADGLFIRARALLAEVCSLDTPMPPRDKREFNRIMRDLESCRVPYGKAYAQLSRATEYLISGDVTRAAALYEIAGSTFQACGMAMLANVAQLRRGQCLGPEGQTLSDQATDFMRGQGVKQPLKIAQVYAPAPLAFSGDGKATASRERV